MNAQDTPTTLIAEIEILKNENSKLKVENSKLKEQMEWFRRRFFGKKSEKIISTGGAVQLTLFDLGECQKKKEIQNKGDAPKPKRKPQNRNGDHKITFPDDLPIETTFIDIPEEDKVCPITGENLVKIGEEVTDRLAFRPGSYFIKRIIRAKYVSQKIPENGVLTADLPESLFNRCQADESLLAEVLTKKFADHLPLYRQAEILMRDGIQISRQTLCQWTLRCGEALKPLMLCMLDKILKSKNVFIDETPVKMLSPGKGKTLQGYMWIVAGGCSSDPPYRVYEFYTNRQHRNVAAILKDYQGIVHSDKYGAYFDLALAKQFDWCPCWVHVRRKFFEAEAGDKEFRIWILERIGLLFSIEEDAWLCSPEERLKIRKEQEEPLIDEIIAAVKKRMVEGAILLPKSKFKEALGYFMSLIPYLKTYINYPFARLDNNVAERALRPLAIGRKNWLFFGNEGGGQAAAVIFSLIQTCRGLGINPREYLEDVMRRIMSHPAKSLEELLPDHWLAAKVATPPS